MEDPPQTNPPLCYILFNFVMSRAGSDGEVAAGAEADFVTYGGGEVAAGDCVTDGAAPSVVVAVGPPPSSTPEGCGRVPVGEHPSALIRRRSANDAAMLVRLCFGSRPNCSNTHQGDWTGAHIPTKTCG